jgi:glycerophosphoryl diester phosphodiesterase
MDPPFRNWLGIPGAPGYPMVIAHRGGAGLAPENTLPAFLRALEVGADAVELDVRLTRDGRVATIHDRRLDRTTTGKGVVGGFTLEELKRLDAGSWYGREYAGERIPTLEEVFEVLPRGFPVYVELKVRGTGAWALARRVLDITRRYERWNSTLVASFNPMPLICLRMAEGRLVRGYIWSRNHPLPLRARWFEPLVSPLWLAPDRGTFSPRLLARSHAQGRRVAAWETDLGTGMEGLKDMGLDAVVTDRPDLLVGQKRAEFQ